MPGAKIIKQDILAMSEYSYLPEFNFSKSNRTVQSIFISEHLHF